MKKRILSIILLGCIALSLIACGGNDNKENNNKDKNDGLIENLLDTEKDKTPVKVEDALVSDEFEFIYNLNEIPDSYWTAENIAKIKASFEKEHIMPDGALRPGLFDFDIDCQGLVSKKPDTKLSKPYTISIRNNNFLLHNIINRLTLSDDNTFYYVLGNDLNLYSCGIFLSYLDEYERKEEFKDFEWVYSVVEFSDSKKISYMYKISEKLAIEIVLPGIGQSSTYTEEQVKQLGEYIISLIDIKEKENDDFLCTKVYSNIDLGDGITVNLKDSNISKICFNRGYRDEGDAETDIPTIRLINENEEYVFIEEFDSLESMKETLSYVELENYKDNIWVFNNTSESVYYGHYNSVVLKAGDKYYEITSNEKFKKGISKDEFVEAVLKDIIVFEN